MSQETINNTPQDSGLGDNLKVAFDKVKNNFAELYTLIGSLATPITKTSDITNDGEDGINPFITALDIPTSFDIDDVIGLQTVLNALGSSITTNTGDIANLLITISTLQADLTALSVLVVGQNSLIASQNVTIASMNAEIVTIKTRLDALES